MTLYQMSFEYGATLNALKVRRSELKLKMKESDDEFERAEYKRRIADLNVLIRESSDLQALLRNYYNPAFWRTPKYTLNYDR